MRDHVPEEPEQEQKQEEVNETDDLLAGTGQPMLQPPAPARRNQPGSKKQVGPNDEGKGELMRVSLSFTDSTLEPFAPIFRACY